MGVNVTGKNDAEGAEACINAIRELAKKVDIPAGLRDLNVKEEDFAVLATNALKDACVLLTRSRQLTKKLWRFIAQRCNHHFHNGWQIVSRFFNYLCNPCP
ncbi:putative alcohol dehydrogenase [Escherichia coli]|uniref:Putative alcohol dehydrogenase n=1 Tax=Escherichia coli TaxID=562 RepID=A0A376TY61_ECOLX|nr:putative alcohol dehydrogenase [Escherichia coli]